jgi:hypothetical protein
VCLSFTSHACASHALCLPASGVGTGTHSVQDLVAQIRKSRKAMARWLSAKVRGACIRACVRVGGQRALVHRPIHAPSAVFSMPQILLCDEVSMLSGELLAKLDTIAK